MTDAAPARPRHRLRTLAAIVTGTLSVLVGLAAIGESQGWPFVAAPAQRWLSAQLGRPVTLAGANGQGFQLHLWGGIRLAVDHLRIGSPTWSTMGPLLEADDLRLSLRWRDVLGWRLGQAVPLQTLTANRLNLQLQRLNDGRANWNFAAADVMPATPPASPRRLTDLVTVQQLAVVAGHIQLQDAALALQLDGQFNQRTAPNTLNGEASGTYRGRAVRATLLAGNPSGWLANAQALDAPVSMTLAVQAGRASMDFVGQVRRFLNQPTVSGRYRVSGPSLAAVGEPLGLTLPQTRRFALNGRLMHEGTRWSTVVDQATVGDSRLGGAFVYDRVPGQRPLLAGRLTGQALILQDLGPALGGATETTPKTVRASGRVLPDRNFNLPSLRAMDANVLVALDKLDFGTTLLQAAAPVRGRVRLTGGVLSIEQLQLTLARGVLSGRVQLDGRQALAHWELDLMGRDLLLEQWLRAAQRPGQAPYASGRLNGQLTLTGTGNSIAKLLAGADGRLRVHWRDGQVSHLLVELAGLDVAQGLGVLIVGDNPLPVSCGAADVQLKRGLATPHVLLVDTRDSLLWVDGSASLVTEKLQLQAHAQPKDWSPLSLRTPLHIDGTLGEPVLSLDKPKLLQRALPAALLALVSPLVALLPLMDIGATGGPSAAGCQALVQRFKRTGFDARKP